MQTSRDYSRVTRELTVLCPLSLSLSALRATLSRIARVTGAEAGGRATAEDKSKSDCFGAKARSESVF